MIEQIYCLSVSEGFVDRGQQSNLKRGPRRINDSALPRPRSPRTRQYLNVALLLTAVCCLAAVLVVALRPNPTSQSLSTPNFQPNHTAHPTPQPVAIASYAAAPDTLNKLLELPPDQLADVDIARMNLLCATGLVGVKLLDVDHALSVLDDWARRVAMETQRHLYRVNDPRFAERYKGSEAHYRAEMLAQVLQEDLGVRYDMTAVGNFSFADPAVAFIHGMVPGPGQTTTDTPGGTCASMPVLYVAVGRRLGYPLTLATTDSHIFARWDGLDHPNPAWRDRFNCETTNGFHRLDDDYYRTWPKPVTERQIAVKGYLKSLSRTEEMAVFLAWRGHHGDDVGHFGFAARCYENAYSYDATRPAYVSWFINAALQSDYRPVTPKLAQAVDRQRQIKAALTYRPMPTDLPQPSHVPQPAGPMLMPLSGINGQPTHLPMPAMPQPGNISTHPQLLPHQP